MTIQQICVHHAETLRVLDSAHTYALWGIRGHALQRRDSGRSSAVRNSQSLMNTLRSLRSLRCMMFLTAKGAKISSICLVDEYSKKNVSKLKNHRERRGHREKQQTSVLSVSSVVDYLCTLISIMVQTCLNNNYIHQS